MTTTPPKPEDARAARTVLVDLYGSTFIDAPHRPRLTPDENKALGVLLASHAALEAMTKELADDIEAELEARYEGMKDHPAMKRRYDRDMESVIRARALLSGATA